MEKWQIWSILLLIIFIYFENKYINNQLKDLKNDLYLFKKKLIYEKKEKEKIFLKYIIGLENIYNKFDELFKKNKE